jgi:hypothetical protein
MLQQFATSNVVSGLIGHPHVLDLPRKTKTL